MSDDSLNDELRELRASYEALLQQNEELEQRLQAMDAQDKESQMQLGIIEELEQELARLQEHQEDLRRANQELQERLDGSGDSALAEDRSEVHSQLLETASELAVLRREKLKWESERERIVQQLQEEREGSAKESAMPGAVYVYEERLREAENDRKKAETRLAEARKELEQMRSRFSGGGMQDEGRLKDELAKTREQAQQKIEKLSKELEAARRLIETDRSAQSATDQQAARQELARLKSTLEDKSKQLEEYSSQCNRLEDDLEDRDREVDEYRRKLEILGNEMEELVNARREAEDAQKKAQLGLIELQSKMAEGAKAETAAPEKAAGPGMAGVVAGLLAGMLIAGVGAVVLMGKGDDRAGQRAPDPVQRPAETAAIQPPPVEVVADSVQNGPPPQTASPVDEQPPTTVPAEAVPPVDAGQSAVAASAPDEADAEPAEVPASKTTVQAETRRDQLPDGAAAPLMVKLAGSAFTMGDSRMVGGQDERPAHEVRVRDFWIGKYEVSVAEYLVFARATGRVLPTGNSTQQPSRPVINVTWLEARAYAAWLAKSTGRDYRLPSEAEWEYAIRAGSDSTYWWGLRADQGQAVCMNCGSEWDGRSPAPVGQFPANGFGLHDMAGNAQEWVQDCYNGHYVDAPEDGGAWLSGDCEQRVVRGGGYSKPASSMRSSARRAYAKDVRFPSIGFRVAASD